MPSNGFDPDEDLIAFRTGLHHRSRAEGFDKAIFSADLYTKLFDGYGITGNFKLICRMCAGRAAGVGFTPYRNHIVECPQVMNFVTIGYALLRGETP